MEAAAPLQGRQILQVLDEVRIPATPSPDPPRPLIPVSLVLLGMRWLREGANGLCNSGEALSCGCLALCEDIPTR